MKVYFELEVWPGKWFNINMLSYQYRDTQVDSLMTISSSWFHITELYHTLIME